VAREQIMTDVLLVVVTAAFFAGTYGVAALLERL
jgi:preprotein translocase subunit SecE